MKNQNFDFIQSRLIESIEDISNLISNNRKFDDTGWARNFSQQTIEKLEKTKYHATIIHTYLHDINLLLSGEIDEKMFQNQ